MEHLLLVTKHGSEVSPAMHCLHVAQQPLWAAAWGGVDLSKGRGEGHSSVLRERVVPKDRVGSKGGGWRESLVGRRINSKGDDHPEGIGLAPGQGVSPWGEG